MHYSGLDPDSVARWLSALAAALDGSGPALLPITAGETAASAGSAALTAAIGPSEVVAEVADLALIVSTSGSTGEPKGVLLSASAIRASAAACHRRLGGPARWLLALPLTHIAGLNVLARCLDAGTAPIVVDSRRGFTPAGFAAAIPPAGGDDGPLYTALVPTQLGRLLDAGTDLDRFDAILLGGAAAPGPLLARAQAAGARVVTTYGMSETCGGCVYDGRPLDDVEVVIDADGRIQIGGPTLFSGYHLQPELTTASMTQGRLITQDLGRFTADGYLEVRGRVDDIIITGGVNIAASPVAAVIETHPQVRACLVVGVPDTHWGQRLVAVIEPLDPTQPVSVSAIRDFVGGTLEPAARPAQVINIAQLPLLASGKPDREKLRQLAARQREG
jgi:O-succinylbenzoic acid--CoA ligase